jgi:N-acetylglucosaminyl-diphospho-decaprenol L-rhamnosyltransferase
MSLASNLNRDTNPLIEKNKVVLEILIITWNCREDLRRCLNSIYRFPPKDSFKITVVENGSVDGTKEMLVEEFPDIDVIWNKENRGVAPARNQGLSVTNAEFIMNLDADTEVPKDGLQNLLDEIHSRPRVGVLGAQLLYGDGSLQPSCKRIPHILASFLNRMTGIPGVRKSQIWRHHMMEDWAHDYSRPVDYVIGANQLIRTEALRKVGLLDDNIFYGPEDVDFCLRMWQNGWEVWYIPHVQIIHHHARRSKRNPFSRLARLHFKGMFYFFRKFRPEERFRLRKLIDSKVEKYQTPEKSRK